MTNFKFSRSLASVLATVALVSSALTGLLYSAPVSATGTTPASNFVPTNGQNLVQGQKFNFQFRVQKTSSTGGSVFVRLANPDGTVFTGSTGIAAASGCLAYFEIDTPANSGTRSCAGLFTLAGIDLPGMSQNSTATVFLGTGTSKTDPGAEVKQTPVSGVSDELKITAFSSDTLADINNATPNPPNVEKGTANYNVTADVRLSVKKQRITSASDYNSFSGDTQANYNAFVAANPAYETFFAVNVDNSGATPVTGISVTERLDNTAQGYYSDCNVALGSMTIYPGNNGANAASTFPVGTSTNLIGTTMNIAGANQGTYARITYLVACDRNTSTFPTSGNAGNNIFEITGITTPSLSDIVPSPSLPIQGMAPISGGAELKVVKEVVSGATNGTAVNSGTTVQYKITVTNASTTGTNCSTPTNLVDFVEGFGLTSVTTISTNAATVNTPARCNGNAGEFAVNVADVQAAYPNSTDIKNTARVIPVKELKVGESVTIYYSVIYSFNSSCPNVGPAPRARNTALLVDSIVAQAAPLTANSNSDGFYFSGMTSNSVTFETATTSGTKSVTYGSGITIYGDASQSNNISTIDVSPDVCKPDMVLVSKYRSTPLSGLASSDALLAEEVEYTIEYANYGARYTAGGLPKSAAKNIVVTDVMPEGASFVKLVSPTGATASVSGNTVTVSALPTLSLGDEATSQVKLVIKMTGDKAQISNTNLYNIARVSANNEDGVYNDEKKTAYVDGTTGNSVAKSVSSTPATTTNIGNNSTRTQITLKGGPDIQVLKTVDIGEGALKMDTSALTYTVKVKNVGTEVANSVMVRDTLPSCTSFASKVSGPDGTLTSDQRNIDYNLGNLAIDQEFIIVFKANLAQNDACKVNNSTVIQNSATATISSSQKDLNVANNTGIANSSVVALNQNAALTKTVDQLVAQPGATLTYTITLKGQGSQFKGTLVDELPANVTFVSADPAAVKDGMKLTWSNVTVDTAKPLVATVKVTVNSDATGTSVNKVTATTTDGKVNFAQAVTSIEVAGNAKVTGYIYFDANRNKKEDKLERSATYADLLKNIRVVAVASNGKEYSAVTNEMGAFMIDKLPAGKYTVKVDINTVKGSYKNVQLNVAAIEPSNDGLTRVADVRANESFDLTAGFRLFTGQTSTGATTSNGITTISSLIALLSFSFLATMAYAELRKKALSL